jgi:AraC-like DNA-binding protein
MSEITKETRRESYEAVLPKVTERCRSILRTLDNREMTVSEIAASLSFFDAAYFCKVFRAHTGMTPTQYARSKRI